MIGLSLRRRFVSMLFLLRRLADCRHSARFGKLNKAGGQRKPRRGVMRK